MSVEELLKPRYKVIAAYPLSHLYFKVGDILVQLEHGGFGTIGATHLGINEGTIKQFPHLFKKLNWWEERKISDLPRYIRIKENVFAVTSWGGYLGIRPIDNNTNKPLNLAINWHFDKERSAPATEQEYLDFKNKQL